MAQEAIFLVRPGEKLVELREQGYDSEAILQRLLADYPALLAGDQMNPTAPRRWLLVSQEMGVPGAADSGDRWSLDHLFLDQDAIPTLIETKRSSDTRIRREVVGQMFDYAANAVVHWPIEKVRAAFERTCRGRGEDPAQSLAHFLGSTTTAEEFWDRVGTNLNGGRIRMVFVADVIPPELRRIVEFLNGQMKTAEVLAVEIKQFIGESLQTLVPRVIGVDAKPPVSSWNETTFPLALRSNTSSELEAVYRDVFQWMIRRQLEPFWGTGTSGTYYPCLRHKRRQFSIVYLTTAGKVNVTFAYIKSAPGFEDEDRRRELAERFNQIEGVTIALDRLSGYPEFPMSVLRKPEAMKHFLDILDWYFTTIRANLQQPTS